MYGAEAATSTAIATGPPSQRRPRIALLLWGLAAAVSIAVLVVAIIGRDRGDGPSLRAMAANESMSDEQARTVADNTVRVWVRERNAGHLANLEALSCPANMRHGTLAGEIDDLKKRLPVKPMQIIAVGALVRNGSVWTLNTHFVGPSVMFTLRVFDGELRVCDIDAAPVP